MKGKVQWFNEEKGYGFIEDKKGKKYFAHFSEIQTDNSFKKLMPNQEVEFDIGTSEDSPAMPVAKNIEIQR